MGVPEASQGPPKEAQRTPQGAPGTPGDLPWDPRAPQGTGNIYTKTPDQPQDAADMLIIVLVRNLDMFAKKSTIQHVDRGYENTKDARRNSEQNPLGGAPWRSFLDGVLDFY